MAPPSQNQVPSEKLIQEKWDRCIERSVTNTAVGGLLGGLAGLILFRRPVNKAATAGFGAGVGAGMAYQHCRFEFENYDLIHGKFRRVLRRTQLPPVVTPPAEEESSSSSSSSSSSTSESSSEAETNNQEQEQQPEQEQQQEEESSSSTETQQFGEMETISEPSSAEPVPIGAEEIGEAPLPVVSEDDDENKQSE